ncbi:MAG: GNAT family N-acetyltransferase [Actinomycetes bacterium]
MKINNSPAHILDSPVWNSLAGPHAELSESHGLARKYPSDISPFYGVSNTSSPQAWADLAELSGPTGISVLLEKTVDVPARWEKVGIFVGIQLTGQNVKVAPDKELIPLGVSDVPEMLNLISRTEPGPFKRRTIELGGYLGLRINGELVAMAGRRLNPPGWVEISAVCTAPEHRGKGYADRLVRAVAAGIREDNQLPFLHVSADNTNAIRLYERMGFELRIRPTFAILRPEPQT